MITDTHRAQLPGPGWTLHLTPERKMVVVTAPDGTENLFDTPEQAIAWANDAQAADAKRRQDAETAFRVRQQARERGPGEWTSSMPIWATQHPERSYGPVNRSLPAPGWAVRYRRGTDDWEASRGVQREVFDTEEEAIAFTHAD